VQGGLTALMTAQFGLLARPAQPTVGRVLAFVVLGLFVLGCVVSGIHLFHALRPRMVAPSSPNRFAFPSVAAYAAPWPPQADARQQCAEARQVAKMLAELAMTKHRHVRRALYWTCAALASSFASLLLLTALG
jgi:hypothetical protein